MYKVETIEPSQGTFWRAVIRAATCPGDTRWFNQSHKQAIVYDDKTGEIVAQFFGKDAERNANWFATEE